MQHERHTSKVKKKDKKKKYKQYNSYSTNATWLNGVRDSIAHSRLYGGLEQVEQDLKKNNGGGKQDILYSNNLYGMSYSG